jgi:tRNA 2-selenouridine synthase
LIHRVTPEYFLKEAETTSVLDVRSPQEYSAGHIPAAVNLPLFDDSERKEVGTIYKNNGREASVIRGLDIVGPKLTRFVKEARVLAPNLRVLIHCWRGGMRSESMAWLLDLAGFEVMLLEGGYKSYRRHIRDRLGDRRPVIILGGKTGSGKTEVLNVLERLGQQVLKLEDLANHRGSAFGALGQNPQPTSEQFENNLYAALRRTNSSETIWMEDESRAIGKISIPEPFFHIIRSSQVLFIDVPKENRVKRLVREYSEFEHERLASAISRIGKRLGGLNEKRAKEALDKRDFDVVADILLGYYDKAYLKGLSRRDPETVTTFAVTGNNPEAIASQLIEFAMKNNWIASPAT